jgi:CRP/FNR family cyclic AMP-dependent transcriptional regulator
VSAARAIECLKASPLFKELGDSALAELSSICQERAAAPDSVVISEGTSGDVMYLIRSGRVRVEKRTPYNDTYTVTFFGQDAGDFFGELALLDREQRSASVVAETQCELLVIDRRSFVAFGDRYPGAGLVITRRIARNLADRLRRANEDTVTLFTALVHELEEKV